MENSTNTTLVVEGDPFSEWMVDTSIDRTVTGLLWSLVAVVTFVVNTFVCIYTIIYWCMRRRRTTIPKYTTQQSSLLLFFLCFLFAVESLLIFPFIVVAASSGEWLVYQSVDSKVVTCTIIGITLNGVYSAGVWTLGALSLERFLFVSQPHIHKNKFTNKVVFGIIFAVLIISSVISFFPFFNLGGYSFNQRSIICIPPLDYVMGRIWLSLFITFSTLPILFIITMVTMTFIFARKFARSRISRHESTKESDSSDDKKKGCRLYCSESCLKTYGAFATLIVIYSIKLFFGSVTSLVTLFMGAEFLPARLQAASTFIVVNLPGMSSILLLYFRPEFRQLGYWGWSKLRRSGDKVSPWEH